MNPPEENYSEYLVLITKWEGGISPSRVFSKVSDKLFLLHL
jgi:hypothetical protein